MTAAERHPAEPQMSQAHGLRLRGERDAALRVAASRLSAALDDLDAAALIARVLLDTERVTTAGELAVRLVDAQLRRGELPAAWTAAQLALEAGGFAEDALRRIAAAFGKGSPRLTGAPPKLPQPLTEVPIAPAFASLAGPALLDAAEKIAARVLATPDSAPADGPVPELPLFGSLEPAKLLKLLGRLELREADTGSVVVHQGEEGREAFALARGVVNVIRTDANAEPIVLATLGPGAIFGEMALVSEAPRAASVVAVEPVQLLVVSRQALEELAAADPAIGRDLGAFCYGRMISNLMRHSAILSSVEPAQRKALIARFASERFERGQPLVRQDQDLDRLFLLASGGVQVSQVSAGERTVLAELGPGQVVGEISLVLRRPATADVVALHTTVALSLTRDQFHEAIREHPALLRELYEVAVQREQETRSVLAQKALDVSDVVLL